MSSIGIHKFQLEFLQNSQANLAMFLERHVITGDICLTRKSLEVSHLKYFNNCNENDTGLFVASWTGRNGPDLTTKWKFHQLPRSKFFCYTALFRLSCFLQRLSSGERTVCDCVTSWYRLVDKNWISMKSNSNLLPNTCEFKSLVKVKVLCFFLVSLAFPKKGIGNQVKSGEHPPIPRHPSGPCNALLPLIDGPPPSDSPTAAATFLRSSSICFRITGSLSATGGWLLGAY